MIKKIILHNFMAHGHSEIALAEGVTVLTGPNNTGKSAVVEALRCLSENPALGRAFIRHGKKQATVAVELEDGTLLRWHRKKTTSWYEIERPGQEPESFYKMGQGKAPPQVLELLRIQPVDIDDKNRVDVHLSDQRTPIFLIDRPPAQVAHFFAASSEGAHLLAMQDLLKSKIRDAKKDRQTLQLAQQAQRGMLDRLAALPDIALALEAAEAEEHELTALAAALPRLAQCVTQMRQLRERRALLARRRLVLEPLDLPPTLEPVDRLLRHLARRAELAATQQSLLGRRHVLEPLAGPSGLEPVRPLARHLADRQALAMRTTRLERRKTVLQALDEPPALAEAARPAALLQQWRDLAQRQAAARGRGDALETLNPPPVLEPVAPLAAMLQALRRLNVQREQARQRRQAAESALVAQREAVAARLEAIGHCPTCGQVLSRATLDEFLEGGHGH
ncbi:AAA family ATPase [Megalodesulfovibrio gigas]|uniref:Putative DNA repair ATPase-like protein n=1 Tax=Megalodesulfovibrio gigas (strain ATCC 19364 / DSM 1382 / NCIMB 9332 / VKM B-1759) TaxID=1121448 RepID=T2GBZ8_MEGG1|nr:AAA family ATPase [Megalodesulfovibrio gigas]AGW13641.1 putative DNA repair ATPase-like protein [Megalodesulfovibrio gigas DSM 1382 = ATCC 19364]